jgi:hypothetical protein
MTLLRSVPEEQDDSIPFDATGVFCALHFDVSGEIGMERPSLREEVKKRIQ